MNHYRIDWIYSPTGYTIVTGLPVKFPGSEKWTFFVAKRPDAVWSVSEESTGACVASAVLRRDAIAEAEHYLTGKCSPRKFTRMVRKVLREWGPIAERHKPRTVA